MLAPLLLGSLMVVVNMVILVVVIVVILGMYVRKLRSGHLVPGFLTDLKVICIVLGVLFVGHLLQFATAGPSSPVPEAAVAVRDATRSLLVVLPLVLVFLFSSGSASFVPVMIKVATMGQQVSADKSRAMGLSLLSSTAWGSIGAIAVWWLLGIWPSLVPYILAVAIAGLLFGRRIFQGVAVHPDHDKWSYAFLTMLVLLGPAVTDSPTSDGVGFVQRLLLFMLVAVYGTVAVTVFDAFLPRRTVEAR